MLIFKELHSGNPIIIEVDGKEINTEATPESMLWKLAGNKEKILWGVPATEFIKTFITECEKDMYEAFAPQQYKLRKARMEAGKYDREKFEQEFASVIKDPLARIEDGPDCWEKIKQGSEIKQAVI